MDATVAAMKRKNFADFLRKSFFSKNFCVQASGGPSGSLRGPSRGGNVARCIAEGTTVPWEKNAPDGRLYRGDRWSRINPCRLNRSRFGIWRAFGVGVMRGSDRRAPDRLVKSPQRRAASPLKRLDRGTGRR